ncbi:MAG TPA: hypothetical protein VNF27_10910 [Candidatus Binataceae bacterium]|nr:hypothetical protein [Candidatus Binataceae bacterium]
MEKTPDKTKNDFRPLIARARRALSLPNAPFASNRESLAMGHARFRRRRAFGATVG